jgi:hypothetical protein
VKSAKTGKAAQKTMTGKGARHVPGPTHREAQTPVKAAVDTQVAEFERIFTPRYEW